MRRIQVTGPGPYGWVELLRSRIADLRASCGLRTRLLIVVPASQGGTLLP